MKEKEDYTNSVKDLLPIHQTAVMKISRIEPKKYNISFLVRSRSCEIIQHSNLLKGLCHSKLDKLIKKN